MVGMISMCNNVCLREDFKTKYKLKKGLGGTGNLKRNQSNMYGKRYLHNYKRCQSCSIFIICTSNWCPCCKRKLKVSRGRKTERPVNAREFQTMTVITGFKRSIETDILMHKEKWIEIVGR
jgi:hypothetical protein